jgi:hypothetical protein
MAFIVRREYHPYHDREEGVNPYIQKRGDKFVIIQRGTGRTLSEHDTREKAEESFAAMEANIHEGGS